MTPPDARPAADDDAISGVVYEAPAPEPPGAAAGPTFTPAAERQRRRVVRPYGWRAEGRAAGRRHLDLRQHRDDRGDRRGGTLPGLQVVRPAPRPSRAPRRPRRRSGAGGKQIRPPRSRSGRPVRISRVRSECGLAIFGLAPPAPDGQPRVAIRDLPPDVQLGFWRTRLIIMIVVGLLFGILTKSWVIGLTLAILAGIVDTLYRSRTAADHLNGASQSGAQRRTRWQLRRMRRAGYFALDARPIPNSREYIDHLVVGPTGVYAIDSEKWDSKVPVRTLNGKRLYRGPESQKDRLEHAVVGGGAGQRDPLGRARHRDHRPARARHLRAADPLGHRHHQGSRRVHGEDAAQVPQATRQAARGGPSSPARRSARSTRRRRGSCPTSPRRGRPRL